MAIIILLVNCRDRHGGLSGAYQDDDDDDEDDDATNRKYPSPLTLTSEKEHHGSDNKEFDDVTLITKLLQIYPKGIQQGIYHNRVRQLNGGSQYLGILQLIMEFDTH